MLNSILNEYQSFMSRVCQPSGAKNQHAPKTLLTVESDDECHTNETGTSDSNDSSNEEEQPHANSLALPHDMCHEATPMNDLVENAEEDTMDICEHKEQLVRIHLPADIVYTVFLFTSRSDLLKVHSLVCKEWYRIAHLKQLWWFHTLVQNPYYFEQSTALMWQQKQQQLTSSASSNSLLQLQASVQQFSPNTPLPASNTSSSACFNFSSEPNTPISPAAQVFQFKHYFVAESQGNNENKRSMPKKQPRAQFLMAVDDMPKRRKRSLQALQAYQNANGEQVDDSMLANSAASSVSSPSSGSRGSFNQESTVDNTMTMLLDCRAYYLEQALVKKFTTCTLTPASSSANGIAANHYQLQQVQPAITPTSATATTAFNFVNTPTTPTAFNNAGAGAPAVTPLPNAFANNNNNAFFPNAPAQAQQPQQEDQVPNTPTRNFLRSLASRFSFSLSGSSTPSSPSKSNPFGNVPLIQADAYLESMLVANGPGKRFRHTMTAVTVEGKECLYIIGGMKQRSTPATAAAANAAPNPDQGESVVYKIEFASDNSSVTCTKVPVVGKPPQIAKHSACAYYAPCANDEKQFVFGSTSNGFTTAKPQIIIFGGAEGDSVTNNCYVYDINSSTFEKLDFSQQEQEHKLQAQFNPFQAPSVPAPRTNHSAAIIGNEMYIVAGGIGQTMTPTSEIWVLNLLTRRWRLITHINNSQLFTPRLGCAMTVMNNKLVIYGGGYWKYISPAQQCWGAKYQDLFIFDTESCTFTKIEAKGNERPRTGTFPASALCGTHWYIMGGAFDQQISNEIYMLDLVTFTWKRVNSNFYGADSTQACVVQNKLVTFGGFCYQPLNSACVLKLNYMDIMQRFNAQSLKKCVNNVAM